MSLDSSSKYFGISQHIIQHSHNREPCFYSEQDYHYYLDLMHKSAQKRDCRIHAYVLMTNYVHLLITPMSEKGVTLMMRELCDQYMEYFNSTYGRIGILWDHCFKASLITSDVYLLSCMCYIELSPVRATLVKHPIDYIWSSYVLNALNPYSRFIDNHPAFSMLGTTTEERQFVYRGLFLRYLDNDNIHKIRDVLNHDLLGKLDVNDKPDGEAGKYSLLCNPENFGIKERSTQYDMRFWYLLRKFHIESH